MTALAGNPRYVAYARAHNRTPAEQLEQDRKLWPGGSMTGFVCWNTDRIREFGRETNNKGPDGEQWIMWGNLTLAGHHAYDAWLKEKFG